MSTTVTTDGNAPAGDRPMGDEPDSGETGTSPDQEPGAPGSDRHAVPHRLRDLDRRGRLCALAFALALVLAPVQAYLHVIDDWIPSGDPALIGIQTLNVGTSNTPLTGQPSTSGHYVGADRHVDHLGPLHNYLMAGPVRALDVHTGMLAVSVLIISTCALLSAWAFFRRLGPGRGALAAVLIGLTMFTTGASTLMIPVSSNIAGYPLFCSAVLLWCLLRGDLRLLPVAAGMTTFAAQQHLSVLPTLAVLVVAALSGLLWHWGHDGRWRTSAARRQLALWVGIAALVSLVLWTPMLFQEVKNDPGNLTNLVELTSDQERPAVGTGSAVRQVTQVLGLPLLLGRTDLGSISAAFLLLPPSLTTQLSALGTVALLGLLAWRWRRRHRPEQFSLTVMAGVLVVAGLINGSSVLTGAESLRMVFYHWIWPLTVFVTLALLLGAGELLRWAAGVVRCRWSDHFDRAGQRLPGWAGGTARPALVSVALLAVVVPAAINPTLDRPTNELQDFRTPLPRPLLDDLVDQVLEHEDQLDGPFMVEARGGQRFTSLGGSLALYLMDAGLDARLPHRFRFFVADNRIAWSEQVEGNNSLLLVHDFSPHWQEVDEGELIADVMSVDPGLVEPLADLADELGAGPFVFGPDVREAFDRLPAEWVDLAEQGRPEELRETAFESMLTMDDEQLRQAEVLSWLSRPEDERDDLAEEPELIDFLLEHPLEAPTVDPEALAAAQQALAEAEPVPPSQPLRVRVYLLDGGESDNL